MPTGYRMLPGNDLEGRRFDPEQQMADLRESLPPGMGADPEVQGALAWEAEDNEAARFAYRVADSIRQLRGNS